MAWHRSPPAVPVPRRALAALLASSCSPSSACGGLIGTEPPATPTDFPGLAGRMKLAGVVLDDWVSGDAGCADPNLVPASISFNATGLDQATPVKIYLYVFRNRDAWERHRDAIGPCAAVVGHRPGDVRGDPGVAVRHRRPGPVGAGLRGRGPARRSRRRPAPAADPRQPSTTSPHRRRGESCPGTGADPP